MTVAPLIGEVSTAPITGQASFAGDPSAARLARSFLQAALDRCDVDADTIEIVLLLASELVTNAVFHARTELTVRYLVHPNCVRVEVLDGNSRLPVAVAVPVDATSGRGLALVQSLADNWGSERNPDGKIVWFEIPMPTCRVSGRPTTRSR